jgi:PAS domain S-box-containing protein
MATADQAQNRAIEVLIVEDSPTQAAHLASLLEEQGYRVTAATNGRQALAAARARHPTLVISDILMPEMDGYALCTAIKSDAELKHIPVILVTDLNSPQDVIMGLQCCADNFVTKPYDPQFLLARITQSLKNRGRRAPTQPGAAVEVELADRRYRITVERHQILDLLVPTYEEAVRLNQKLREQQQELARQVQERTAANERLRAEAAERQRLQEELDRFFTLSLDLLCIAGVDGRFKRLNPAWERVLGYRTDELLARPYLDFVHPDDRETTLAEAAKLAAGCETVSFENRYRCKDGSYRWLVWASAPDHPRQLIYAAARDVTEQKYAEQELHRRSALLEAANKELEAFSYSVSHDLRAPLRHIDGFADLLRKRAAPSLDDKSRHYLETISQAAKQMGTLIDDLLVFSRIGRAELRLTQVSLDQVLHEALEAVRPLTQGRAIVWRLATLPRVPGDPAMLRQVLVNLLDNAVKYTQPREPAVIEVGVLEDEAGRETRGQGAESDGEQGNDVVIYVKDNGVGFDMRYAHKLFGVFQRLHSASEFDGTGIGLANVRRIIARHGGRTWAEGEVGKGAILYFSLPVQTEARG